MIEKFQSVTVMLYGPVAGQFESTIRDRFPNAKITRASRHQQDDSDFDDVDCLIGWRFPPGIFRKMPNLRWIQSASVGVDDWIFDPTIRADIRITNTKGVYSDSIAEYAIWSLLTLSRRFHVSIRNQAKRRWSQSFGDGLSGKVLGIVGLGCVGKSVACRAKACDMQTIGIVSELAGSMSCSHVDKVVSYSDMETILGDLDAVVLCLPLTAQSRGLFDGAAIRKMKHGAIIVNIAREGIMDYPAIVEALRDGQLAGAALDVFDKEPLSRWSRLWGIENLLITPHNSALTTDYKSRVENRICDNFARFIDDRPLRNLVDREKGY